MCHSEMSKYKSQIGIGPGDVRDAIHRKRGLRIMGNWKMWVSWVPASERESRDSVLARPDDFVRYGRCALVGLWADDVKAVSIERLCLSLSSCRITFNSKVIKSFVPEPKSRKVICVYFGFPMSISHIPIFGYVTTVRRFRCLPDEINPSQWYTWYIPQP